LKLTGKEAKNIKVVINGIGAAGYNIAKFLMDFGVINLVLVDKNGS
jgi:malate dehydrogenase (oxaloacetate-decarboxylating)